MASDNKLDFDWDEDKATANFKKHKVNFEEAKSVFGDPFAITISDPVHSIGERRFIDIGRSLGGRILVVSYTHRRQRIRLINCRNATKAERKMYEEKEF